MGRQFDIKQISGSFGTGSIIISGSIVTGSLLKTASVLLNDITFTKGDGSQFTITVDTGSAVFVDTGSFAVTESNQFTGSQYVTGSVVATEEMKANIFMNPQLIQYDITVPGTHNALLISPVSVAATITVETPGNLVVI
jgi:hypothetical protein